jgi:hypothetical protein
MSTTQAATAGTTAHNGPRVLDVSGVHYATIVEMVAAAGRDAHLERLGGRVRLVVA